MKSFLPAWTLISVFTYICSWCDPKCQAPSHVIPALLTIQLQPISEVAFDEYFIDDQLTKQLVLEGRSKIDDMYFL